MLADAGYKVWGLQGRRPACWGSGWVVVSTTSLCSWGRTFQQAAMPPLGRNAGCSHSAGAGNLEWLPERCLAPWPQVYAVDLLGQGGSAKPPVDYTMELWADQLVDFMAEFVQSPAVLVGNSLGSLAAVMASAQAPASVAGLCLLNCAGGMNNKVRGVGWVGGWAGRAGRAGRAGHAGRQVVVETGGTSQRPATSARSGAVEMGSTSAMEAGIHSRPPPAASPHSMPPSTPPAPALRLQAIADDWRIRLAMPIFLFIDFLLNQPRVAQYLFDRFRTPDNIRQVLQVGGWAAGLVHFCGWLVWGLGWDRVPMHGGLAVDLLEPLFPHHVGALWLVTWHCPFTLPPIPLPYPAHHHHHRPPPVCVRQPRGC